MNRALIRISAACVTALALATTACTSGESGTPSPGQTIKSEASATTSSAAGRNTLAGIKPCDLLSTSEAAGIGVTAPGDADTVGTAETCDWTVSGDGGLIVGVRKTQGLKDLGYEDEKTSPAKAGKFEALKVESPLGAKNSCEVVISVSESSTVQVTANLKASSADTAAACERATKVAELIAPKLP